MVYTKEDFKRLWEANSCGSGITYDDIADCAKAWGISSHPRTRPIDEITYRVLKAAQTNDAEEFNPNPAPKESEDERIKREILELVSIAGNGNQFEEIKDWLEKQGEKKSADDKKLDVLKFIRKETCCGLAEANNALLKLIKVLKERPLLIMDKPRKLKIEWEEPELVESNDERDVVNSSQTYKMETLMTLDEAIEHCKEKSCDNSLCSKEHKQLAEWLTELKGYRVSVTQETQKTVDTDEPKFKAGAWIINTNNRLIWQITYIRNSLYYIRDVNGNEEYKTYDELRDNYRLWTIQDAKDGDVLISPTNKKPFVYNGNHTSNSLGAYFGLNHKGELLMSDSYNNWTHLTSGLACVHPATKEQRDLLLQTIKEADTDAKDIFAWLEKQCGITKLSEEEQNGFAKVVLTSCAVSFIDYLDAHKYEGKMCVSNGECEDIENAFHNAMWDKLHRYYCKYIEKQGEQKPAWSEEDENFFNDTIAFFERTTTFDHGDWLKSLKQRIGG